MPVFFPGNVQEVLDLGLHALALLARVGPVERPEDRHRVADAAGTADVSPERVAPVMPEVDVGGPAVRARARAATCWRRPRSSSSARCSGRAPSSPSRTRARTASTGSSGAARRLARASSPPARATTTCARRCATSASTRPRLERAGVRILKLGHDLAARAAGRRATSPAASTRSSSSRRSARFVEPQVKEVLYGTANAPRVVGKRDEHGERLLAEELDLDADSIAVALASRLRAPRPDRLGRGARGAPSRSSAARPLQLPMAGPHAVLLLRLPAQQLDPGARGHARRRRHRLPHDGAAEPRGQGRDHRDHADGRRGRAVDRHGAVHRRPPPRPEPRRRHLPPLGLARDPRGGRGRA